MCGIVGYVGQGDATSVILEGLRRLEYRGYDSAGLALTIDGAIVLRRSVGKLDRLARLLDQEPVHGPIGIGHTRWATHGRPSEINAHPHVDCTGQIVVIQNGIVENYLPLKQRLRDEGHTFKSETDTEVIAHLIESFMVEGAGLEAATRRALEELRGNNTLIVMSAREPDKLITARLGNAGGIVIGLGVGQTFIASDITAILSHTREMVFLDDQDIAVVSSAGFVCRRLDGTLVEKQPQTISWDPVAAAKGGYEHFLLKEIEEQPRVVADTIRDRILYDPPGVALENVPFTDDDWRHFERIVIVACGTAWHAGLVAKFMLEDIARIPTEVDYADEFRYRHPLVDDRTLLIAITQSGETVDVLVSMEEARRHGATLLGVVNTVGSQAARMVEALVYTRAGPEISVASTKAFTCQLTALYLLSLRLAQARGTIDDAELAASLQRLTELPHRLGDVVARTAIYAELATAYHTCRDFLFLGRGINYPIALEGALKLKEISYIHAEGYPAGEMKHGPIALIDEEMPVVAIATHDRVYEKTLNNVEQVKARGGILIAVVGDDDTLLADKADHVLRVPTTIDHLQPIINVIPLQLLAYHLAVRRGCDVDQPRNLAKSVTVE